MCAHVCGDQKLTVVFPIHPLPYSLRQGLSVETKAHWYSYSASHLAPGISLYFLRDGATDKSLPFFHVDSRGQNSSHHACTAEVLTLKLSYQPS